MFFEVSARYFLQISMNQQVELFLVSREKIKKIKQTTTMFKDRDNQKICVAEYQLEENLVTNCKRADVSSVTSYPGIVKTFKKLKN